jgi:hypothetical protein
MKFTFLSVALCLSLLAACGPAVTDPKTKEFVLKESQVPLNLPLPVLDWEFYGKKFSDKAQIVEQHTSATGQRFVVYGFTTSIANSSADAEWALYFKGRKNGNDEWVLRWNSDGTTGEKSFVYVPGTELDIFDTEKFKIRVK